MEFAKSLVKLAAVDVIATMTLIGQKAVLLKAMDVDPGMLPERILALVAKTIAAVLAATLGSRPPTLHGRESSGGGTIG